MKIVNVSLLLLLVCGCVNAAEQELFLSDGKPVLSSADKVLLYTLLEPRSHLESVDDEMLRQELHKSVSSFLQAHLVEYDIKNNDKVRVGLDFQDGGMVECFGLQPSVEQPLRGSDNIYGLRTFAGQDLRGCANAYEKNIVLENEDASVVFSYRMPYPLETRDLMERLDTLSTHWSKGVLMAVMHASSCSPQHVRSGPSSAHKLKGSDYTLNEIMYSLAKQS